jgi:hypothetical protein
MKVKLNLSKFQSDLEKQRKFLVDRISFDHKQRLLSINPDRSDLACQYAQNQRYLILLSKDEKRLAEIDTALE